MLAGVSLLSTKVLGFSLSFNGLPSCSCGWREISACVGHQDGGEVLEDPALVGISICYHCLADEESYDFLQGWTKGGR